MSLWKPMLLCVKKSLDHRKMNTWTDNCLLTMSLWKPMLLCVKKSLCSPCLRSVIFLSSKQKNATEMTFGNFIRLTFVVLYQHTAQAIISPHLNLIFVWTKQLFTSTALDWLNFLVLITANSIFYVVLFQSSSWFRVAIWLRQLAPKSTLSSLKKK